jgi:MoxR-like ATPase
MTTEKNLIDQVLDQTDKVITGYMDPRLMYAYCWVMGYHVIWRSVPGLAKTRTVNAFVHTMDGGTFKRLQMTPSTMPTDIVGTEVYDAATGKFWVKKGPIFVNSFLADEINRCGPKTQAALLEAMAELQVSLGGETFPLERPFIVSATMNPVEAGGEGVYPLPEAQLDRFGVMIDLPYLPRAQSVALILDDSVDDDGWYKAIEKVAHVSDIVKLRKDVRSGIYCSQAAAEYINDLVEATRPGEPAYNQLVKKLSDRAQSQMFAKALKVDEALGGSPRPMKVLLNLSRIRAWHQGREYILPEDVQFFMLPVLRHRLMLTRAAKMQKIKPDALLKIVMGNVDVVSDPNSFKRG